MDKLQQVKQLAEEATTVHVRQSMMGDAVELLTAVGTAMGGTGQVKPEPTVQAPAEVPRYDLGPPPPPPVVAPPAPAGQPIAGSWFPGMEPQTVPRNGDAGQYPVPWVPPGDTVPQTVPAAGAAAGIITWLMQTLGRQGAEMALEALKEYFGTPGNGSAAGLVSRPECMMIYDRLPKAAKEALKAHWCGFKFPMGLTDAETNYFWTIMVSQQAPPRRACCPDAFQGGSYCPIY